MDTVSSGFRDPELVRISDFLVSIGLPVAGGEIQQSTFLPGITVQNGGLLIDEPKLVSIGDVLHEAGHLAMLPPLARTGAAGQVGDDGGMEMAAIAWSYAAGMHLKIPAEVVFHGQGYRGGSQALVENFANGRYIGVPMLEWVGIAVGEKRAIELGVEPYPHVLRWLRSE
jgi:hypothetical protein